MELSVPGHRRTKLLNEYLQEGAKWERPTSEVVAALGRAAKYKKARVGCKAAERAELMLDVTGELSAAQATEYRALSARANFLSRDKSGIAYATKELCRCFARRLMPLRMPRAVWSDT